MNRCQFGHLAHCARLVPTWLGPLWVWDWSRYWVLPSGYCSGRDDISRTLFLYECWEPQETCLIRRLLIDGDRRHLVLDIGAHIGWYSLLAATAGYRVHAFEGDPENVRLLRMNAWQLGVLHRIQEKLVWFDETTPCLELDEDVELAIIDLEGSERHAIRALGPLLPGIKNLLLEVSPVFHPGYPELIDLLETHGFTAWELRGDDSSLSLIPWENDWSRPQFNLLFRRGRFVG